MNEKLWRSSREKNPVTRFGYNKYMAHHFAFIMKVAAEREPKDFSEEARDPQWIEVIDKEIQALVDNETWDLVAFPLHKKVIDQLPMDLQDQA